MKTLSIGWANDKKSSVTTLPRVNNNPHQKKTINRNLELLGRVDPCYPNGRCDPDPVITETSIFNESRFRIAFMNGHILLLPGHPIRLLRSERFSLSSLFIVIGKKSTSCHIRNANTKNCSCKAYNLLFIVLNLLQSLRILSRSLLLLLILALWSLYVVESLQVDVESYIMNLTN